MNALTFRLPPLHLALALVLLAGLPGCAGYRLGDTSGRDLQGVRSVYVPTAKNNSLEPDLQTTLTNAIVRRFNNDGTLEVNQNGNADSEMDVTITDVHRSPYRTSSSDILTVTQYQLQIDGTVTFTNRRMGRAQFKGAQVVGTTTYFIQADQNEGERQALPLAADDFAQHAVQLVTEGW